MSLEEQILNQAQAITGALEGKYLALLSALCTSACASLALRLKDGMYPEDCADAFIMAAAFQAAAGFSAARDRDIQEFKAGDLSIRQGSSGSAAESDALEKQAEGLMRPYLKDPFCFTGV